MNFSPLTLDNKSLSKLLEQYNSRELVLLTLLCIYALN